MSEALAHAPTVTQRLPIALIDPNPDQPRTVFEPEALQELAASILAEGLMQPITVRPVGNRYQIVAGERRWRAHGIAGIAYIDAHVRPMDDHTMMVQALIENAVRKDITIMDEAVAFQRCLDAGLTINELARRLGLTQPWRVTQRLSLLRLRPEYQRLVRGGGLTSVQAFEMSTMSARGQDALFERIRNGECDHMNIRAVAAECRALDQQEPMFAMEGAPSMAERKLAASLESRFQRVIGVLRVSTVDNEVVAARKVNPNRAATLADMAREMALELARIEAALRAKADA
jgi:ParB family chromosome partitioning protein